MQVVSAARVSPAPPTLTLSYQDGAHVTLPVSGYRGLHTFLTHAPASEQAQRPAEWLARS
eukprot:158006-Rhodomonas_salina.1